MSDLVLNESINDDNNRETIENAFKSLGSSMITNLLFNNTTTTTTTTEIFTFNNNSNEIKTKRIHMYRSQRNKLVYSLLNGVINLLTTFALSIAIYLLITNLFLLVYKLNHDNDGGSKASSQNHHNYDDIECNENNVCHYKQDRNNDRFYNQQFSNHHKIVDTPLFVY